MTENGQDEDDMDEDFNKEVHVRGYVKCDKKDSLDRTSEYPIQVLDSKTHNDFSTLDWLIRPIQAIFG